MYDWNDIRYFLAVARTGSTLAAGRALCVNPTTVARRIAVLEDALGMKLFDRRPAGYTLTEAGNELRTAACRVEVEAGAFADQAGAMTRRLAGVIRLTTNEGLATALMGTALGTFRQIHPAVRVDLLIDEKRLDIARGAADVALRTGEPPVEAGLVGRRLLSLPVAVYCSQEYAERNGHPTSIECLRNHMIIGVEGPIAGLPAFRWLDAVTSNAEIVTRISSITSLISAVKAGMGVTVVPCFLADPDAALTRCLGPIEGAHSDLWLVTREDLRNVPRIRTFVDFLADHIKERRHLLAGKTAIQTGFAPADSANELPELVASDVGVDLTSEDT